jgi:hypothetical protein
MRQASWRIITRLFDKKIVTQKLQYKRNRQKKEAAVAKTAWAW